MVNVVVVALAATAGLFAVAVLGLLVRLARLERDLAWAQRDALVGVARSARVEGELASVRSHLRAAEQRIHDLAARVLKAIPQKGRRATLPPVDAQELSTRLRQAAESLAAATRALDHVTAPPPGASAAGRKAPSAARA